MAKIQVRRGTKAQLDALISGSYLDNGEIGFTTDTHEVFVGTGTTSPKYLIGGVQFDTFASRPAAGNSGRIFHATDTLSTYLDNGVTWTFIGSDTLDGIPDGTTYGKVLNTQLSSGKVNQIDDGSNNVTAAQARTHINDVSIHRELNDDGSSSTELWSADKIASEVAAAVSGIDPQDSIISQLNFVTSEPVSPSVGDRHINTATGDSSQTTQAVTVDNIYEWNGVDWTETVVSEGMYVWDETLDTAYIFTTSWVKFGSVVVHNNLSSKQGGTTDEYYHITASQYTIVGNTSGTNTGDQTVSDTSSIDLTLTAGDITADLLLADGGSF